MSLIEIGDEERLTAKIISDLPNFMGFGFEDVVRDFLVQLNFKQKLPLRFTKIGSYWNRPGNIEVDIVAIDEEEDKVLFGECKLSSSKVTIEAVNKLKSRAKAIAWKKAKREEYFAVFTADELGTNEKRMFEEQGIIVYSLKYLISLGHS